MKESEFIELLNLYLDHEISAADAVRLEAEVQNNPARRRVYQQYCRMQKACKLLTTDFQTETTTAAEKKVVPFDPAAAETQGARRRTMGMVYTFGSVAAAACVALIFVNRVDRAAPAERPSTVQVAAPAANVSAPATVQVASDSIGPRQLGSQRSPKLVPDPLLLSSNPAAAQTAATDANDHLKWLASLQIAPLPQHVSAEELRFDARPATLRPDAQVLGGNRGNSSANAEMTAFRFQK